MNDPLQQTKPSGTLWATDPPAQRDRSTSREAAKRIKPKLPAKRQAVLNAIRHAGRRGLTDAEGIAAGVVGPNTWRPRRVELANAGYIKRTGEKRRGSYVWRAVE